MVTAAEDDSFTSVDAARLVTCPHSIEEQTKLILEKIKAALDAHDTGFERVFNTDIFVTDRSLRPAALRTTKRWMDRRVPGVPRPPGPNVLSRFYSASCVIIHTK